MSSGRTNSLHGGLIAQPVVFAIVPHPPERMATAKPTLESIPPEMGERIATQSVGQRGLGKLVLMTAGLFLV